MKTRTLILAGISSVLLLSNFTLEVIEQDNLLIPEGKVEYRVPGKINTIIKNSCYECHNTNSKNNKAKKKLDFDKIGNEYSTIKRSGKLKDIAEVLTEGEMPPEKYLKHNPGKALSPQQKSIFIDWANFQSRHLLDQ